jgi:mevalonate kinase
MKGPLFYSKILLFGEYGIIEDSKGLSIPYNFFNGALKIAEKPNLESEKSNNILADFCSYLKQFDELDLDLISFEKHINKGLYFDSSITKGYGVGSSGALVAAIYDKYSNNKITVLENLTREKLLVLKSIFSKMESFFHGKSSGLDPLNSYLSIPILIKSKDDINVTGIPSQKLNGTGAVFLIDSGKTGSTAPMVSIFMEKMGYY